MREEGWGGEATCDDDRVSASYGCGAGVLYLDMLCTRPSSPGRRPKAGEEPDDTGMMRKKLLQFMETSKYYYPQEHVSSLPRDGEL